MDLVTIVVCLTIERFFAHKMLHNRFNWFGTYAHQITSRCQEFPSSLILAVIVIPPLMLVSFGLSIMDHALFGLVSLGFNIAIFYYCLGPINPFYPVHTKPLEQLAEEDIGNYLVQTNNELFAILFWFLVGGPSAILGYRLVSLSKNLVGVQSAASYLLSWLDWFPARMTVLLYWLAGNFQAGYRQCGKLFIAGPKTNNTLLHCCGLAALNNGEIKSIIEAETLVEHSTVIFLVLLAFCTIVAWI